MDLVLYLDFCTIDLIHFGLTVSTMNQSSKVDLQDPCGIFDNDKNREILIKRDVLNMIIYSNMKYKAFLQTCSYIYSKFPFDCIIAASIYNSPSCEGFSILSSILCLYRLCRLVPSNITTPL